MSVSVYKEKTNGVFPVLMKDPITGTSSSRINLACADVNTGGIVLQFMGDDIPVHISLGVHGSTLSPSFGLKISQIDKENPLYRKRFFIYSTDLQLKWVRTDSRRSDHLFEEIFDNSQFSPTFYGTKITISLIFEEGLYLLLRSSQMQDFFSTIFSRICEEHKVQPHMVYLLHHKLGVKENHEIRHYFSKGDAKNFFDRR